MMWLTRIKLRPLVCTILSVTALLASPEVGFSAVVLPPRVTSGAVQQRNLKSQEMFKKTLPSSRPKGPLLVGPRPPGPSSIKAGGPRFTLEKILFNRSHFISKKHLQQIAAAFIGHPLTVADLYKLVDQVNAVYARRGLITSRAILPPQKIDNAIVHIELIEARASSIDIVGSHYTRSSYILSRIPVQPGDVLDPPQLSQSLTFFNQTNLLGLTASLKPGSKYGTTTVLLHPHEPPRGQAYLLLNNDGARSTGRNQVGLYAVINEPLGLGDKLIFSIMKSRGNLNGTLGYQIPLNARQTQLAINYSRSQIHIIGGAFAQLDILGHSDVIHLSLKQPFVIGKNWLFHAGGGISFIDSTTNIASFPFSHNRILNQDFSFNLQYINTRIQWTWSMGLSHGIARDLLGRVSHYWLMSGRTNAIFTLPYQYYTQISGAWQLTGRKSLPPSQLFQLGGAGSVYGYPLAGVSGVQGFNVQALLGRHLPWGMSADVFYDQGVAFANFPSKVFLSSINAGLQGHLPGWNGLGRTIWSMKASHPIQRAVPNLSSWTFYFNVVVPLSL